MAPLKAARTLRVLVLKFAVSGNWQTRPAKWNKDKRVDVAWLVLAAPSRLCQKDSRPVHSGSRAGQEMTLDGPEGLAGAKAGCRIRGAVKWYSVCFCQIAGHPLDFLGDPVPMAASRGPSPRLMLDYHHLRLGTPSSFW